MSLLKKLAVTLVMSFSFISGGTRALLQAAANSPGGGNDSAPDHSESGGSCRGG